MAKTLTMNEQMKTGDHAAVNTHTHTHIHHEVFDNHVTQPHHNNLCK